MAKEKPQAEEDKLPLDKFLKEHPGFAKDAVPGESRGDISKSMSLEELKAYIDDVHRSGDEK